MHLLPGQAAAPLLLVVVLDTDISPRSTVQNSPLVVDMYPFLPEMLLIGGVEIKEYHSSCLIWQTIFQKRRKLEKGSFPRG